MINGFELHPRWVPLLLVNISRTSLLMMLPLKTKADRLIPNQVAH